MPNPKQNLSKEKEEFFVNPEEFFEKNERDLVDYQEKEYELHSILENMDVYANEIVSILEDGVTSDELKNNKKAVKNYIEKNQDELKKLCKQIQEKVALLAVKIDIYEQLLDALKEQVKMGNFEVLDQTSNGTLWKNIETKLESQIRLWNITKYNLSEEIDNIDSFIDYKFENVHEMFRRYDETHKNISAEEIAREDARILDIRQQKKEQSQEEAERQKEEEEQRQKEEEMRQANERNREEMAAWSEDVLRGKNKVIEELAAIHDVLENNEEIAKKKGINHREFASMKRAISECFEALTNGPKVLNDENGELEKMGRDGYTDSQREALKKAYKACRHYLELHVEKKNGKVAIKHQGSKNGRIRKAAALSMLRTLSNVSLLDQEVGEGGQRVKRNLDEMDLEVDLAGQKKLRKITPEDFEDLTTSLSKESKAKRLEASDEEHAFAELNEAKMMAEDLVEKKRKKRMLE